MNKELLLFLHPAFGVFGIFSALWVFVDALNANEHNIKRIRIASFCVAFFMVATWIVGGYWYVTFYGAEKAIILKGPWSFAHNLFMEVKEHLFFAVLLLSLYLPVVAIGNNIYKNKVAKKMMLTVAGLIIVFSLLLESAGAIINSGVKLSLLQSISKEVK